VLLLLLPLPLLMRSASSARSPIIFVICTQKHHTNHQTVGTEAPKTHDHGSQGGDCGKTDRRNPSDTPAWPRFAAAAW
jgi:hypothetical protein